MEKRYAASKHARSRRLDHIRVRICQPYHPPCPRRIAGAAMTATARKVKEPIEPPVLNSSQRRVRELSERRLSVQSLGDELSDLYRALIRASRERNSTREQIILPGKRSHTLLMRRPSRDVEPVYDRSDIRQTPRLNMPQRGPVRTAQNSRLQPSAACTYLPRPRPSPDSNR
jgi:hypothetical protein